MDKNRELIPARQFIRRCKANRSVSKVADSLGTDLTAGKTLISALAMRRYLVREVLKPDEPMVGLLIRHRWAGSWPTWRSRWPVARRST